MFEDKWSAVNRRNGNLVKFFYDKGKGLFTVFVTGDKIKPVQYTSRFKGEAYRQYNLALV